MTKKTCPYCDIEITESAIERNDGCCPECGTAIGGGRSLYGDDDDFELDDFDDGDFYDDDDEMGFDDFDYHDDVELDDNFDDDFDDDFDDEFGDFDDEIDEEDLLDEE